MSDNYFDLPSRIEDAFAEIDSDIVMDLLNTDEDYAGFSDRMDKLKTQYPVIDKMNEDSGEIRMTAEEHRAYVDYLNLARQMEDMERQRIYANFLLSEERKESKKNTRNKSFFGISAKTIDFINVFGYT